jgi:hypothetical protein
MFSLRLQSAAVTMAGACLALVAVTAFPAFVQGQSSLSTELRGGSSIPAGDLDEVTDAGGLVGVGIGWNYNSRIALRVDGDFEFLNEDRAGSVTLPRTYLWHFQGGVELNVTNPESSTWRVRAKGGAGVTVYDTKRLTPGGDDFVDTNFSASGGLSLGRMVTDWLEVGGFGKVSVVFTDKDEIREVTDLHPSLTPFSKASSFPLGIYLRWQGIMPQM